MNKFLYSITLDKLMKELQLEEIYMPVSASEIKITNREIMRPGLALAGFFTVFEPTRMQIIGRAEMQYLYEIGKDLADARLDAFFAKKPVAVVITTNFEIGDEILLPAKKYGVPLIRTKEKTSPIMASLIASLNTHLANRITQHGVLVEVFGEGVLILGDSGIGKSETAIALVERGHRLIADDAVEIKRVSAKTLVGSAPSLIKHYVELRGIGIIDVRRIYGMGAVKDTEKIDLVIHLEQWVEGKMYDRFGLDDQTYNILGIDIPSITVPVRPGRSLPIILEIAAMNHRQKKMGYNTAAELEKQLLEQFGAENE
ncbi:MAG: HPr(Ser) kinase/phosphatase [Clostridia bacterium]|nr:HPr(Ser) kinase/phosphatase [Clostridia bacterium]